MDAISFVLGIKSSYLRSTHLRDLVYRGRVLKTSKIDADGNAEPQSNHGDEDNEESSTQAASQRNDPQSAWVMAVYEDDAGEEQKWKRTVTSSGQSEYRINNRVVNAKQYNDALEEENILIKARNFLVFQGDVENIANQSPKDLTRLVEQISGSLEFKNEYEMLEEEAEKAAEEQASKLNQRRTIGGEIKRFSEQKKEYDDYNKKSDERDDAIVTHVMWKLYHFQRTIEESGEEIERLQDELKEYRRGVETFETRLDAARTAQTTAGREVASQERRIKKAEKEAVAKQNELIPIEEKLNQSYGSRSKYVKRIAEVTKERDKQTKTVERLQNDLKVVQKAQTKWEDEWKKLAKQDGRELSEEDLQEYNRLKAEVNKRSANAQVKLEGLLRQRKADEETVASSKLKIDECEKQLARFKLELDELKDRKVQFSAQSKQTTKDIEGKKKEYTRLSSDRLKIEHRRTELDEKINQTSRQLLDAEGGRRQSAKERQARETLSQMKKIHRGVFGRVHELCKPKAKKYETAVSTVLGRHFDSIVVDSEKTAKDCIDYLRQQRAGLATFIPLDTIKVKTLNSNLKGMHKNMRLAIDTVDYEATVERAISFACSNTMVCDDMATARFLCFEKRVEAKAVTLDGTVIHKGGLMTGGRGPNDKNRQKVWDDNEVNNQTKILEKLMEQLSALPRVQQSLADEELLLSELSALEQRSLFARDEIKTLDKNIESKKKEVDFVQGQIEETTPKYKKQTSALEQLQKQVDELQAEVGVVEDKVFASFCKRLNYENVRAYESQQGALQQQGEQKRLEFAMQRTKLESQLTFENGRLQATTTRITGIEDASKRDEAHIKKFESEKAGLEAQLEQFEGTLQQLQDTLQQLKDVQNEKASAVADARREVQKRSKDVDSTLKAISGLEADAQRNASGRYALLRKCKIEEIKVPLKNTSDSLDSLPVDDMVQDEADPDAMEVDGDQNALSRSVRDYGIELDFDHLEDDLKEVRFITMTTETTANTSLGLLRYPRICSAGHRCKSNFRSFKLDTQHARH